MKKGILLISLSSLCIAVGQMFWKLSAENGLLYLVLGLLLYGFGAVLMILSFRYGHVSVLQPFNSLSYIFAIVIGYFILDEYISFTKIVGIIFIISGIFFLSRIKA